MNPLDEATTIELRNPSMLSACTIIARNYSPFAPSSRRLVLRHHPDGTFTSCSSMTKAAVRPESRIEWRRLSDIGIDEAEMRRLAGIYDVPELSTAVKPLLLLQLLARGEDASSISIPTSASTIRWTKAGARGAARHRADAAHDAAVSAGRRSGGQLLHPRGGGLQPRIRRRRPASAAVSRLVVAGDAARSAERRREMMFTDQRWIDFVPCFFEHHILKDPGYNVAYWNLHARALTLDGRSLPRRRRAAAVLPLQRIRRRRPWLLSRHQGDRPRMLLSERPALGTNLW